MRPSIEWRSAWIADLERLRKTEPPGLVGDTTLELADSRLATGDIGRAEPAEGKWIRAERAVGLPGLKAHRRSRHGVTQHRHGARARRRIETIGPSPGRAEGSPQWHNLRVHFPPILRHEAILLIELSGT